MLHLIIVFVWRFLISNIIFIKNFIITVIKCFASLLTLTLEADVTQV